MKREKIVTGTWFQPFGRVDYPSTVFKKNEKYWEKEFLIMEKTGFDTFIFQFAAHNDVAYYDSDEFKSKKNILNIIRQQIIEQDFDLALGLYLSSDYYTARDYKKVFEDQFYNTITVFNELQKKFKNYSNLKYWYIPQEIESTTFSDKIKKEFLIDFMNKTTDHIRANSNLPIMIAPYFSLDSLDEFTLWWTDFLKRVDIDIMIMQDGMGCFRNIQLEDLNTYYSILQKICKSNNVKLWSTLENFKFVNAPDLNNKKIKIIPGPADRIKKQIEIERQYVDKIIFFEFAHFMSPQFSRASKKLYADYLKFKKYL